MFCDMTCRCNCTAEIKSVKSIVSLYVCGSINEHWYAYRIWCAIIPFFVISQAVEIRLLSVLTTDISRWLTFPSACCNKLNGSIQHRYEVFNASSIDITSELLCILKRQPCTALHGHTPPQNPPGKNNPPKHAKSAHINSRKRLSYALKIKFSLVKYGLWYWLKGNRLTKLEVSSFFLLARSVMFSPL